MPAWSFHIKLATDISNVLKLNEEEENLFILANLIPDIKSGYLIPMKDTVESRFSHYYIYENELCLPDLEKYRKVYWNKDDIVSTGIYCHLLLDYYLNGMLKNDYFIYNDKNIITGMKTVNGVFNGTKEDCIKFKHKNFNIIAKSLGVKSKFIFPKEDITIKTDDGNYTIMPKDIEATEKWIFDNYKDQINEFPQNELLTEEELDTFFKDSSDFVLKHIC